MRRCTRLGTHELQKYLDNELAPPEMLECERHLIECGECRRVYEDVRAVVDAVRGVQPLYEVPASSRRRAQAVVARHERSRIRISGAVAAAFTLVSSVGFLLVSPSAAGEFCAFAVDSHLRYTRRAMPLDVASSDPRFVSSWLGSRLPFPLELPNYPSETPEGKRYHLVGARLLQYRNADVALLVYEMDRKPISLLMTSDPVAAPSGGTMYRSGSLAFHFSDHKGLKVIAWTDRGTHYSLVSELGARGAESCMICHGSAAERRVIEQLQPGAALTE
jgi:anti-sigma factor RsiW